MMNNLQATLLFPVRDADARKQWLIASAVMLASFIVPILPMLVVMGYGVKIMRQVIDEGREPTMPEWQSNDLGALLAYWTDSTDPLYFQSMAMMPTNAGFMTRNELVQRYASKSGRSVHDINFYHALGLFRLTVIIAQIYIRYDRGQTQDRRFTAFGPMIPLMARAAFETSQR